MGSELREDGLRLADTMRTVGGLGIPVKAECVLRWSDQVRTLANAKQAGVTEAMVERAVLAYWQDCASGMQHADSQSANMSHMRAALLAAIGAEGQPDPQEGR